MLRATRVDSTELTHRVRFPALHMASPLEVATVNAYLDTPEGREFVAECRAGRVARAPVADGRHGTLTGYSNDGCRCVDCLNAYRSYQRDRRARIKAKAEKGKS